MSKRNKPRGGQRKPFAIIRSKGVAELLEGMLTQHPFDVAMAALVVLNDVDPTVSEIPFVKNYMAKLTEPEQQYAVMLEAALNGNKLRKSRMQTALDEYFEETGERVEMSLAAQHEGFTAWLPAYNEKFQAQWRLDNPEAAAAYDAQVAQQATLDQGVGILQATDPQGDVSELIPDARPDPA